MQQVSGELQAAVVLRKAGLDPTHHFIADLEITPAQEMALFVGPDGSNNRRLGGWEAFVADVECYTPSISELPFARGESDLRNRPPPVIKAGATLPIHVVMTCYGGDTYPGSDTRVSIRLLALANERVVELAFTSPVMANAAP